MRGVVDVRGRVPCRGTDLGALLAHARGEPREVGDLDEDFDLEADRRRELVALVLDVLRRRGRWMDGKSRRDGTEQNGTMTALPSTCRPRAVSIPWNR